MALNLGELVAIISADDSKFRRVMGGVHGALQRVGKLGGLAALAGSASHLAVALAPAAGALAVMPGLLIAVKVSTLALSLALNGVGDAFGALVTGDMKAYQEALKAMPPSARAVVRELAPAFRGLQATAQEAFFKPMRKASRGVGRDLREPVGRGTATITAAFGRVGAKILGVGRDAKTLAFIPALSLAISSGIGRAGRGVKPLIRGVRDFASASLGSFKVLGTGAGNTMRKIGEWLSSKAAAGKPMQWITSAVERLKQLGRIGRNIGSVLKNVFRNAGAGQTGGLLTSIEKITARMKEWAASAEGQSKIQNVFRVINETAGNLVVILPILGGALGLVVGLIKQLPAPAQGAVSQFLALALVVGLVAGRLGPLARGLVLLFGALGKVAGLLRLGAALTWVGGKLKAAALAAGRFAKSVALAMGRAAAATGRAALAIVTGAGRMAAAFGRAAWAAVLAGGRMAASAAGTALRVVGAWLLMGTQALLQAARVAAAWLIAMGPVGLAVAAAIAAVVLIIKNWDKIVAFFTKTLPKWLKVGLDFAVGLIKKAAQFGFLGPIGLIISHWGKISKFFTKTLPDAVGGGIKSAVNWVTGLPGRVISAVGDMGRLLINAGRDVLLGFWNGLVSRASWLASAIGNLIRRIVPGPVLRVLGINSPSRLFMGYGKMTAQGLALGMARNSGMVAAASTGLAQAAAWGKARGTGPVASAGFRAGRSALAPAASGAATGPGGVVLVKLDATGADSEMLRLLRKIVKVQGRGNVQIAFGGK